MFGECYSTSDKQGVALWLLPGETSISLGKMHEAGMLRPVPHKSHESGECTQPHAVPSSTNRNQDKAMRVIHDDDDTVQFVDDAAMSFMALTVHRLNAALQKGGVEDAAMRQEVCSNFLFEFAYHHDAGWLAKDGKQLFPMVVFAERRKPKQGENLGGIEELHVPTQATSWHEYALGVASRYFEDEGEGVGGIRFGSYNEQA